MEKLQAFAEMILARNTFETLCEIIASMTDDDVKKIIAA